MSEQNETPRQLTKEEEEREKRLKLLEEAFRIDKELQEQGETEAVVHVDSEGITVHQKDSMLVKPPTKGPVKAA